MTKKLKWRLSEKPTPESVIELLNAAVITKEEAKEILFSEDNDEERDKESLRAEIKFLRELCDKLANKQTIVEQIKYIEKPYVRWGWHKPYEFYCSTTNGTTNAMYLTTGNGTASYNASSSLSDLKTF